MSTGLFPNLEKQGDRPALQIEDETWSYSALSKAAHAHARRVASGQLNAVVAEPSFETAVAIVGNVLAGAVTVPLNPKLGAKERDHIIDETSRALAPDSALFVLYTSGTTGAPKGAVLTSANISANLDALKDVWAWTAEDVVVHALPWFHVHGLILGLLGSLRVGGCLRFVPKFEPAAIAHALGAADSSVLFAVPTMIHRLANAAEDDSSIAAGLGRARLLVSGSAGLPVREHRRIENLTGHGVYERYGTTESMIACAVPVSGPTQPGYVGPPLAGTELKLINEAQEVLVTDDDETIGEIAVRSASVFAGYLERADATTEVVDAEGWFYTGDLATRRFDGSVRIIGRKSTDLIKTGGYRVGAGEIEACLLEHPAVAEVAVVGVPDDDLGQRIETFIVCRPGAPAPSADELIQKVADDLTPHKRPRGVHFVDALPRNAMGKVQKGDLVSYVGRVVNG